ncbi:unnamed protein product [Protopolystoma xenopodis]|uniref:Uncharacterized protein n=1 Tax=Protopolystoma xenopodis TaxID=117903 RepID=A0A448WFK5_9PLAT|nr:unnamed protein product [Protopolystoma xenopodis]
MPRPDRAFVELTIAVCSFIRKESKIGRTRRPRTDESTCDRLHVWDGPRLISLPPAGKGEKPYARLRNPTQTLPECRRPIVSGPWQLKLLCRDLACAWTSVTPDGAQRKRKTLGQDAKETSTRLETCGLRSTAKHSWLQHHRDFLSTLSPSPINRLNMRDFVAYTYKVNLGAQGSPRNLVPCANPANISMTVGKIRSTWTSCLRF